MFFVMRAKFSVPGKAIVSEVDLLLSLIPVLEGFVEDVSSTRKLVPGSTVSVDGTRFVLEVRGGNLPSPGRVEVAILCCKIFDFGMPSQYAVTVESASQVIAVRYQC